MNTNTTSSTTSTTTEAAPLKTTIVKTLKGPKAYGVVVKVDGTNDHIISLNFRNAKNKRPFVVAESRVDLKSMKTDDIIAAASKACYTGSLATFDIEEVHGKMGVAHVKINPRNGNGMVVMLRKGKKPFTVAAERIDLVAMKASTVLEAVRKAIFNTGRIATLA